MDERSTVCSTALAEAEANPALQRVVIYLQVAIWNWLSNQSASSPEERSHCLMETKFGNIWCLVQKCLKDQFFFLTD